jgi:hypothetical protein
MSHRPHLALLGALALALLAAGCAGGPGAVGLLGKGRDARWLTGTWQGGYHCALGYGDARMTLELTGSSGGRIEGTFAFQVTEPLTQIPPGRFRVEGALGEGGAFHLEGVRWIDWPTGFSMPDLEGRADRERGTISGTVPSCGQGATFYMERAPAE